MEPIRVVWGTATGPTPIASYDAALAEAGVHNYNLVTVSSMIPAEPAVEVADTAPELGPPGGELTVVQARATTAGPGRVSAALGWVRSEAGPGLFYEAAGETDPEDATRQVEEGLAHGQTLRDWRWGEPSTRAVTAAADAGTHTTAVVLGVYGDADPIVD